MRSSASSAEAVVGRVERRIADRIAAERVEARGHVAVRAVGVNQRSGRPDLLRRGEAVSGGIGVEAVLAQGGRAVAAPSAASGRHGDVEEDSAGARAPIVAETPVAFRSLVPAYTQLRGTPPHPSRGRRASGRLQPMGRRVLVTGVGVVSSIGTGVGAFWDALADGVSGASVLELEGEPPTPVCRVEDFDARGALRPPRRPPHGPLRAARDRGRAGSRSRTRAASSACRTSASAPASARRTAASARSTRPTARTSSAAPTASARS